MYKIKSIILFASALLMWQISEAQLPVGDPTWQLSKIDTFSTFNNSSSTGWWKSYNWGPTNNGLEYNDSINNVSCVSGWLVLKADTLIPPKTVTGSRWGTYYYQSGAIQSHFKYKYGYYEISAKLPKGKGFWPAFWMNAGGPYWSGLSPCDSLHGDSLPYYNEIDMLENNGITSIYNQVGGGYDFRDSIACTWLENQIPFQGLPVSGDITQEHRYACFWEHDRMTFYFDDVPIKVMYDPKYTPHNPMYTIINFAIDNTDKPNTGGQVTTFPAYFKINHFKIWQLQAACGTVETFCGTAFNSGTYTYAVKKSISIGGSGCTSSTINTSSNVGLWATDYILLGEGTTINGNGSGSFIADITQCPN